MARAQHRVGEVARRARVSVRTLHHDDQLGLRVAAIRANAARAGTT